MSTQAGIAPQVASDSVREFNAKTKWDSKKYKPGGNKYIYPKFFYSMI